MGFQMKRQLSVFHFFFQSENNFLLVLDAKNMAELGRAEVSVQMPYGFHGTFVPIWWHNHRVWESSAERKQWVSPKTKTPVGSYFECCSQLVTLFWEAEETFGGEASQAQGTSLWSLWFSHALSLLPGPLQCEQLSPVLPILPLIHHVFPLWPADPLKLWTEGNLFPLVVLLFVLQQW